jgi:periplasmic divalent cation tolerance protein
MKAGGQERIVLVTCGNGAEARRIARAAVTKRLAACVNIVPGSIRSIYRWKGKVEQAREVLMVIKTRAKQLAKLEREVQRLHSYEVPEFIALAVAAGSHKYLAWIGESVKKNS